MARRDGDQRVLLADLQKVERQRAQKPAVEAAERDGAKVEFDDLGRPYLTLTAAKALLDKRAAAQAAADAEYQQRTQADHAAWMKAQSKAEIMSPERAAELDRQARQRRAGVMARIRRGAA